MKKGMMICLVLVLVYNCREAQRSATAPEADIDSRSGKSTTSLELGCYAYHGDGSSVQLEITANSNPVKGNLQYQLAEKDRNTGTFTGNFKEGELIGTYTFMSEGTESKREVAFLLKNGQLIEGYGEMNENGTAFRDRETISFTSSMPLSKSECPL
jgi:hypothetical protein